MWGVEGGIVLREMWKQARDSSELLWHKEEPVAYELGQALSGVCVQPRAWSPEFLSWVW